MNKEEIEAGNKIIAEWVGLKQVMWPDEKELMWVNKNFIEDFTDFENFSNDSKFDWAGSLPQTTKLQYHCDWNWLMGVYIKLSVELDIGWKITSKYVNIYTHIGQPVGDFDGRWGINCPDNVIVDAWRAIVSFIKWHNDNIQQNNKI